MSQYYNSKRSANWNYGGSNWKLSRSKIDLFISCQLCFYIDNKLGVGRPKGFPFNLNSAVDHLLKKEFDIHRVGKTAHPLMSAYGIDAVPFQHEEMDKWRENFVGVQVRHKSTDFLVTGAVDDIWINKNGELHVVDYKATSKDTEVNLDAEWQDGYKRQMEIYQWLLTQKGFSVSNTGYFVYANGIRDKKAFDGKLEFDVSVIPYKGSSGWVEEILLEIKKTLSSNALPKSAENCDYCNYRRAAGTSIKEQVTGIIDKKLSPKVGVKKTGKKTDMGIDSEITLFG